MNLQKMMQQAQQMQQKMGDAQAKIASTEMDGAAGGSMVTVRMNGKHQLLKISIDDSLLKGDKDMLEDLIIAAHNDALKKLDDAATSMMQQVTGGLNLPPGLKLPF